MRTALKDIGQNGSHAGLILARYLPFATTKEEKDNQKRTVMTYAIDAVKHSHDTHDIYQSAFDRWKAALKAGKIEAKEFTVDSRMIIGLGSSNVLEAGITLHQTYGVPYIPGSALKGLTAHYAYENGVSDEHRKWIFGEQDFAGLVQFHDAWLEPKDVKPKDVKDDCLLQDVMTPHHQDYYGQDKDGNIPPSEFESPVPVPFLAVQGTFCVALSCEDNSEQGKKWLKFVWQLLGGALSEKGIGGKTNSGYGYGELKELPAPPPPPKKEYQRGDKVMLTRLSKKDAEAHGKNLLFKDADGNLCIVKKDDEKTVKEKTADNPSIELIFATTQTQNQKFYQFCLPKESSAFG